MGKSKSGQGGERRGPGSAGGRRTGGAPGRRTLTGSRRGGRPLIQRKADPAAGAAAALEGRGEAGSERALSDVPSGGGAGLDHGVKSAVESATGESVGDVRVHSGAASARAAGALGAKAFTVGSDIHLGAGSSASDSKLMAHETAHTLQQRGGGGVAQAKSEVSQPGDPLEQEADRVADAATSGGSAPVSVGFASLIQRDVVEDVEERLSYGVLDWAITDEEASEAFRMLTSLDQSGLEDALGRLSGEHKSRLLDNLPGSLRSSPGFTRLLCAMGPSAIQPYLDSLLSYGVFDWAITDSDALRVFEVLLVLPEAEQGKLWTKLGTELRQRLVVNLQRTDTMSADRQGALKGLFDGTPDGEVDVLQGLLKLRFRITFEASTSSRDTPLAWEAGGLRRLWDILAVLPPAHVEGNSALDYMHRYEHDEGHAAGGVYRSGSDSVAMSYDPDTLESANRAAEAGDPLRGVNRFDKVALHEVGHAVDSANGHREALCIGNSQGGDWESHDTSSMASTLVAASGGPISSWPSFWQKPLIIGALQAAIAARAGPEVDDYVDNIPGLDEEQKEEIKGDDAVRIIRNHMNTDGGRPWYKYPSDGGVVELGGRIYQESYSHDWWSYDQGTRDRKVSTYQYRAPGEWFAEAYAAYYYPADSKGQLLAQSDRGTKEWFDANVDPYGGREHNTEEGSGGGGTGGA